jgi:hypothetical protein
VVRLCPRRPVGPARCLPPQLHRWLENVDDPVAVPVIFRLDVAQLVKKGLL